MLAPIVLAAGQSRRMGSPKALLRDREGCPFVVRIVRTLAAAGFRAVTVVTGPASHEAIVAALSAERSSDPAAARVRFALNDDPDRGQLSSIWVGIDAVSAPDVAGILLSLVDVPFVSERTIRAVADAYHARPAPIVRPADGLRHGHPVIFDRALFGELQRADVAIGAKMVVRAHASETLDVPVSDEGAFLDIDTPEDYERAVGRV